MALPYTEHNCSAVIDAIKHGRDKGKIEVDNLFLHLKFEAEEANLTKELKGFNQAFYYKTRKLPPHERRNLKKHMSSWVFDEIIKHLEYRDIKIEPVETLPLGLRACSPSELEGYFFTYRVSIKDPNKILMGLAKITFDGQTFKIVELFYYADHPKQDETPTRKGHYGKIDIYSKKLRVTVKDMQTANEEFYDLEVSARDKNGKILVMEGWDNGYSRWHDNRAYHCAICFERVVDSLLRNRKKMLDMIKPGLKTKEEVEALIWHSIMEARTPRLELTA